MGPDRKGRLSAGLIAIPSSEQQALLLSNPNRVGKGGLVFSQPSRPPLHQSVDASPLWEGVGSLAVFGGISSTMDPLDTSGLLA